MSLANQLVLYESDSVEVSFCDGGELQVSPCGACFIYTQPASQHQHPVLGEKRIQQRTQYTISTFRSQVQQALDFRNRFAARPYVCKEVLDPDNTVSIPKDVVEFCWLSEPGPSDIHTPGDGSLRLSAVDDHASVSLDPSQQLLTVRYLCKVGQVVQRKRLSDPKMATNSTQDISAIPQMNDTATTSESSKPAILNDGCWDYSWVTQHFSANSYPETWQHPCQVLLQFAKKNMNSVHFEDDEDTAAPTFAENKEKEQTFIHVLVPEALPLNCLSSHLHKWSTQQGQDDGMRYCQGKLKVICSQGIIYRFINTPGPGVEIYPGDGSVVRSSGLAGHYFTHHLCKAGKLEERIHSVHHPPPDIPGAAYSIAKLIARGARFLQHLCEQNMNLLDDTTPLCWQTDSNTPPFKEPLSSLLLEECTVSGIGRFTAHSSGRVRILFDDRTSLDMMADMSARVNQCRHHTDGYDQCIDTTKYQNRTVRASHLGDLPDGVCRLLLRNGQYQCVPTSSPGPYHRYIEAATEWVRWVNTSPSERKTFYKDTIHDRDKLISVQQEIKKIQCFNYIVENKVMSQAKPLRETAPDPKPHEYQDDILANRVHQMNPECNVSSVVSTINQSHSRLGPSVLKHTSQVTMDGDISFQSVQDALRQTSQAIKDLDLFLDHNGETHPVKDL